MKVPSGPAVQERRGPTRLQAMSLQNRFLLQNVLTQECEAWSRTTTAFDPKISNSKLSTISIHGPVHEKPSLELGQSPLRPFNSSGDVSPLISGNMALKGADTRNKFLSSAVPKPPLQLHQTHTETVSKVVASGTAYSTSSCATKKLSTLSSIPLRQHGMETHILKESAHVMEAFGTMCQEQQMQTEDEEDLAEMCNSMPEYLLPAVDDREMESLPVPAGLPEFSQCFPDTVEGLRIKKMKLLNAVCCSLVDGPNFSNCNDPTRKALEEICKEIVDLDPEFILKVALYTRQELNIRTTANFLLAVAAWQLPCRSHLRRYFSAAVQLPSDWLEVPKIYQSLAPDQCKPLALPSCLRRAMTDKFKQFTEYQLAKYNTRTDRGKTCKKKEKAKTDRTAKTSRRHIKVFPSLRKVAPALEELQYKFDTDPDFMSHTPKRKPKEKTKDINLKKLIRRLHITEPAHHVQSLLGCRYPTDLQTFSRSRLPGPWDPQLSGKRMKLKLPDTWERQLSLLGNIPSIWEELIDSKKLPFMAMLRNLRNLVKAGISAKHHKKVISRLSNKEAVTQSRQFPFRFLSAYKVILDLEKQQKNTEGSSHSNADIIGRIFKRVASKHTDLRGLRSFNWTRSTLRAVLGIPVVFQMVKREKQLLQKSRAVQYDLGVLKKYRDALDQSIRISAKHNLPPLPGRTVILCAVDCDMFETCSKAKNLCCPSEEKDRQGDSDSITILEVALLLSLMVKETAEDVQLIFYTSKSVIEASASSDSILENVGSIKEQIMHAESGPNWNSLMESNSQCAPAADYLLDLVSHKKQVDTFLMISHGQSADSFFMSALQLYRRQVNAEALFISLQPQQTKGNDSEELGQPGQWRDIFLYGFSEQVLRFISVRGSSRLLEHVGRIDERFDLPKPSETLHKPQNMELLPHPGVASPKIRWQSVRVFISSTFRDMHGERDLLIRSVFPELRARAARHFLSIEEIDLRWGITEEESSSNRQLGLCLSEVAQSKIFIGILGERYGHVPQEYSLPKLPHFEWLQSYRQGASITELEAMQFLQHVDRTSHPKAFFYFRDSAFLRSVPHRWLPDFAAESYEAKGSMSELKNRVSQDEGAATSRYSCEWGGVADGKPYVKELEEFGANVLQDVWECIKKTYILVDACASEDEEEMAQEAYRQYQHHQFCARSKLLTSATSSILETKQQSPLGGSVLALSAGPSEGKTVFMAALVNELNIVRAKYNQEDTSSSSNIIFHFSEASPGAQTVERMLARFCALLNQYLKKESSLPLTYRGLVSEFHSLLHSVSQSLRRRHNLILLIDGADHLVGQSGQRTSDWIPEHLPQRVHLILSVDEDSSLLSSLKKRKDASFLPLGPLEPPDRSEIIRHSLAVYGKRLDESAFNNQMRLIMIKKDSRQPLYLKLVSEELRTFAVYEKVSEMIKNFPATLPPLVQQVLGNLEKEHGIETVTISLTALYVARNGLRERDLYSILTMCSALSPINNGITWEEALRVAGGNRVLPMAPFSYLMRSFKSILGLWAPSATSDSKLHLSNSHLRSAIEKRYFKKTNLSKCVHLLTAAHLWKSTDPEQSDPFRKPDAESISELPYHLLHCGQLDQLSILLTNLNFLSAHATLGLLPHLCEVYSLYFSYLKENGDGVPPSPDVEIYGDFIQRNCSLLTQNPSLFYQQVINEPESSAMAAQAHKLLGMNDDDYIPCKGDGSLHTLRWMNKPRKVRKADSKTMAVSSLPTCVSMSSTGRWAVVGTSEGSVHILDTESGQEVNSFETSCDGISACELFTDSSLCVTSFDGWMELWNIRDGSRLLRIEAHKSQITGCSISPDRKQLATVSLDYYLKLWDTTKGMLVGSHAFEFPLNCVTFHPEGQLIAIGSWDKKITILKTVSWTTVSVLTGHNASIRDVSFAPAGRTVASAALDGEVRLWSWQEQVLLAIFPAHHGMAQVSKFICNGQYLVTAGEDCKVQVWAGCLGQLLRVFGLGPHSPALSVAVSPDNKYLATGYQSDSVKIYTVSSGSLFADCHIPDIAVQALTWLDEKTLVSGSNDGTVRIWDVVDGETKCRHVCQGHQGPVLALAHSPQLLASASEDCTVHIWLVNLLMSSGSSSPLSPCAVLRGHTAGVTCCAFSPDGQLLATGSKDRSLLCWETASSVPSLSRSLPACHRDWITGCAWTSSSILLSCSNDCTLCLWDPKDGQLLSEFLGHQSAVSTVLSMDENVVSVSRDGVLKVWNLAGVELTSISAHKSQINQCAIFSAQDSEAVHATRDGSNLMVTTCSVDGTVKMWRPLMLEKMLTQAGHSGAVRGAAANKDIPSFLTVADDRCLRLWQAPEQKGDDSIVHHCGAVTAIAWSPSRQFVVSGSDTGEIIVWHLGIPLETVQASEQAISHILFTGQKCFYVVSTDHEVARWDLEARPDKGSVNVKEDYSFDVGFLVTSVAVLKQEYLLLLGTDRSHRMLLNLRMKSLKRIGMSAENYFTDIVQFKNNEISVLENSPEPILYVLPVTSSLDWKVTKKLMLQPWKGSDPRSWITSAQPEFGFADATGSLWVEGPQVKKNEVDGNDNAWVVLNWEKKQIHSSSVTALHILDDIILTASLDRNVKIWTRQNLKQVGLFQCEGGVSCLQPDPENSSEIVCGDSVGNVYFLKLQ